MASTDPISPTSSETEVKPLFPGFADELTDISDPFDTESYDVSVLLKTERKWLTSVPLYTLSRHSQARDRTEKGVVLLSSILDVVGHTIRNARALSFGQASFTFNDDIKDLNSLLTNVLTVATPHNNGDAVYLLDPDVYRAFRGKLATRRKIAAEAIWEYGYNTLTILSWLADITMAFNANDFELYTLQFRIAIEEFLFVLDDCYDWITHKVKHQLDQNLIAERDNARNTSCASPTPHLQ
ncbi:hypothetical protein IW261DRAFT_1570486 [Armillaria novae-zelandiae]|uniref:Uncharacterized protein n=1 Tax=Armillaria novae-zelandiae TaxID=153914 RepID=A0AA39U2E0_9AGAR|nr:hypothetical protein IW261DRAFT_1570486 [Armillaria novae-zelandiae]